MSASTRRAALGAILAAPLASVPVVAATVTSGPEAEFIAEMTAALPALREYERLWAIAVGLYEETERQFPGARWHRPEREASAAWIAYCEAWEHSQDFGAPIEDSFERFYGVPITTERGVLLKLRLARVWDGFEADAFADLDRLFGEGALCA